MIITKIYGGLAGQMLQYALGRQLAIKNNTKLYLDVSWFDNIPENATPRQFGLQNFNTKYKIANEAVYAQFRKKVNTESLVSKVIRRIQNKKVNSNYYILEKDFSQFDPEILLTGNNKVLDGFWNSYRYFESIQCILQEDFEINDNEKDETNLVFLKKIQSTNSISIHIRRGDYVSNSNANKFHGVLDLDYYDKAISYIEKKSNELSFFIFSDDIQWAKRNLNIKHPCYFIDHNNDERNFWDIYLMRNCKNNIIANSGFSWWGAWLNKNKDKTVIAPQKWVNDLNGRIDNIPSSWITL